MASSVFDRKTKDANAYATDAPWVEKFRPKSLDEVAAHKEIIETSEDVKSMPNLSGCS